jgi:hypothetical protein
VLRDRK